MRLPWRALGFLALPLMASAVFVAATWSLGAAIPRPRIWFGAVTFVGPSLADWSLGYGVPERLSRFGPVFYTVPFLDESNVRARSLLIERLPTALAALLITPVFVLRLLGRRIKIRRHVVP